VAGNYFDSDGELRSGSVLVLYLAPDGRSVARAAKVSNLFGGLRAWYHLAAGDVFGISLAAMGPSRHSNPGEGSDPGGGVFGGGEGAYSLGLAWSPLVDVAVGACFDDDGGPAPWDAWNGAGAVYILTLSSSNGTVAKAVKISRLHGGLSTFYALDPTDQFGRSVAATGDLDGDGLVDLAVKGAWFLPHTRTTASRAPPF
jgi:hypothetical protein